PSTTCRLPFPVSRVWPRPGIRARGWDPNVGAVREPPLLVQRERSGGMTPEGLICLRKIRKYGADFPPMNRDPARAQKLGSFSHRKLSISDAGECVTRGAVARPSWP